jgi:hypothetical protein
VNSQNDGFHSIKEKEVQKYRDKIHKGHHGNEGQIIVGEMFLESGNPGFQHAHHLLQ